MKLIYFSGKVLYVLAGHGKVLEGDKMSEGHIGLENKKSEEITNKDFNTALSYLKLSDEIANFVIHIYSNSFDLSPYLQRSDINQHRGENFLERLGFEKCTQCNILPGGKCYFKVIEEVNSGLGYMQRNEVIYGKYRTFANNIQEIFEKMQEIDHKLYDSGFELPWSNLSLSPVTYSKDEKAYSPGLQYDFYKDLLDITKSTKSEILVIDAYPSDEILNLYLEKLPENIDIRVLIGTNKHKEKSNFLTVASKFSKKPMVKFEVRENSSVHDRLFFVDNECWVIGSSIKDAATKKPTYLLKILAYDLFKHIFEDLWNEGNKLI